MSKKTTYLIRRIKFALAILSMTISGTLLFTWRTEDSQITTICCAAIFLASITWVACKFLADTNNEENRHNGQ